MTFLCRLSAYGEPNPKDFTAFFEKHVAKSGNMQLLRQSTRIDLGDGDARDIHTHQYANNKHGDHGKEALVNNQRNHNSEAPEKVRKLTSAIEMGNVHKTEKVNNRNSVEGADSGDLLIFGGSILTVNAGMDVLNQSAVYVENGFIADIGPAATLREKYQPEVSLELEDEDILFPGLINSHGHTCMTAFRGIADDMELDEWLDVILPLEANLVKEGFCEAPFTLGIAEMLQGGTTSFVDFYFFEDDMAKLIEDIGIRAVLCEAVFDFASPSFSSPNASLAFAETFLQSWNNHPLVTPCISPHAPYTTSPWIFRAARTLVDQYGGLLSTHLAEAPGENETIQELYGMSPTEYLNASGFLTPNTILAHSIWLSDSDIALIADAGSHISHNPSSNMKLSNGAMRWDVLREAGINVALGTDGSASNNELDMIGEMKVASLLAKHTSKLPTTLSAQEAVYASTMGGARAIGKQNELGSIEVGKRADLAIVQRRSTWNLLPAYDPYSALVYAANSGDVFATIVAGRLLYYDGKFSTIDTDALVEDISETQRQVKEFLNH